MIGKITNNINEIEFYYNIGSIHGEIRMMLSRYVYNELTFNEIISLYEKRFGKIENLYINLSAHTITFDIKDSTLKFQEKFASCMYKIISTKINPLNDCIELFEKQNPKYEVIRDNLDLLANENYYITLFRTSFIKHENSTSCIIQF